MVIQREGLFPKADSLVYVAKGCTRQGQQVPLGGSVVSSDQKEGEYELLLPRLAENRTHIIISAHHIWTPSQTIIRPHFIPITVCCTIECAGEELNR